MKKLINNLTKIIIAIIALIIISAKQTYAILNPDTNQNNIESQLTEELQLGETGDSENQETSNSKETSNSQQTSENQKKSLQIKKDDSNNEEAKKLITIDDIIFGREPLIDINFFEDSDSVKEVQSKNSKALIIQIRDKVKIWYVMFRNISIMVMVIILLYLAIRMLIDIYITGTDPSKKARYQQMLIGWLKSLAILIVMHMIIYVVIAINSEVVKTAEGIASLKDENRLQNLNVILLQRALDIRFSISFPATLLYILVTILTIKYFFVYLKRFLLIMILIITGPFITIKAAYESAGKTASKSYQKWFYDLTINVFEQSVHAIFYAIFIRLFFEESLKSIIGFILLWYLLRSMLKLTSTLMKLFRFDSKSGSLGGTPKNDDRGLKDFVKWETINMAAEKARKFAIGWTGFGIASTYRVARGIKRTGQRLGLKDTRDLNDPNNVMIRDVIDNKIGGIVNKTILKNNAEAKERLSDILELRRDIRRNTESSDKSRKIINGYLKNNFGKFKADVVTSSKIALFRTLRVVGTPFTIMQDITDPNMSFMTFELYNKTNWKKAKKSYEKEIKKSKKEIKKYKQKITEQSNNIKERAQVRSEYRELLNNKADKAMDEVPEYFKQKRTQSQNTKAREIEKDLAAETIKETLKEINAININSNSIHILIIKEMAKQNITQKEDLTDKKIQDVVINVVKQTRLNVQQQNIAINEILGKTENNQKLENKTKSEELNRKNRYIDEQINKEKKKTISDNINETVASKKTELAITIDKILNRNHLNNGQEYQNNQSNQNNINSQQKNNNYIDNNTNNNINQNDFEAINNSNNQDDNNQTTNNKKEERKNIHDISNQKDKNAASKYLAELISQKLTDVIAEDKDIAKIGYTINSLKDENEKKKAKIDINRFINNL